MTAETPEDNLNQHRYTGRCRCGQPLSLLLTSTEPKPEQWVTCPACNKRAKLKKIDGTFNPNHKCDPRCTSAKGNTCTCSCGGLNHGADWGVNNVVAVMAKVDSSKSRHLGEVGKHIVGLVTVATVQQDVGQYNTLFTFVSESGDLLKWFAPQEHAPEDWAVGKHFKLRAKVKRHDSDERFGNSTIVIYCEELS